MKSLKQLKTLLTIGLLAAITFAGDACAGPTWTITTTGIVTEGVDVSGVFGVAGRDLLGLSFTQTITASIDPSQYAMTYDSGDSHFLYGNGPSGQTTTTVDGVTVNFVTAPGQFQEQLIFHDYYVPIGNLDRISSHITGETTTAGVEIDAENLAYSYGVPFLADTSFNVATTLVDPEIFKSASLVISGSQTAQVYATASRVDVSYDAGTNVPEPASIALLFAGLSSLALVHLRRRGFLS